MGKNTNKTWDLLVIGAGASGMMAAITAARAGKAVCILEKLDKAGKKLLATGNGKCNFTNAHMNADCYHGEKAFINSVLEQFTVEECLAFFHSIGIYPKERMGYYYPNSEQAASVVNALLGELERLGVKIIFNTQVHQITSVDNGVSVSTNHGSFLSQRLLIATGLLAGAKLGSDGSMFPLLEAMGHRLNPVLPILCGYYCKGFDFKRISGVRAAAKVAAYVDGSPACEDTGEVQFTDYGLSGIPVFQISHALSKGLENGRKVEIRLCVLPQFDRESLIKELEYRKEHFSADSAEALLNGLINQKLSDAYLYKAHIHKDKLISSLQQGELEKLAEQLLDSSITVTKYRDYEYAQVCTGGIALSEIHWETLESKLVPGVHFAGELLDVDGICGGYNLHFAWASGYLVGNL